MEREANYAAVGAFVLLVAAMAAIFVYWYTGSREHRIYTRYEIYFDGSVSGLTRGASVRYLGVEVGRVVAMHIDPRNASRVQVVVDIDATTPISDRTVAELSLQGITGVLYIDLLRNSGGRTLQESVPGVTYPVIRSTRSNFDVLMASLPEMAGRASEAFERVDELLSDRNVAALSRAFGSIDQATALLPGTLADAQRLMVDLRSTSAELRATAASVHAFSDSVSPEVSSAAKQMLLVSDHLATATAELEGMVNENRADVRTFTSESLPQIEDLVRTSRDAASEIRELAESLRRNPSALLYQPPAQGVEVPR